MANNSEAVAANVVLALQDGVAHIEQGTPLTRLHYFDGKFLRADALTLEQDYHRTLVRLANLAGGWGVVHGLGIGMAGASLTVGAGLAITPAGSTVLSNQAFSTPLADLLKTAKPAPPTGNAAFGHCDGDDAAATAEAPTSGIYEITVGPLEGLCGNEAVYGKLCEDACVTDSQRPYWREGLVLRLRPIALSLAESSASPAQVIHLRNRVASAYFAAEPWLTSSLLSAAGLASGVWCNPAQLYGRDEVPIGLLMREATSIKFIDAWSARRERMDTQARGYWQGRMAMRPWNVFIAQMLQFQCQLSGLFEAGQPLPPADDCEQLRKLLDKTRKELESMLKRYGESTRKILMRTEGKASAKEIESVANHVKASYAELDGLSLSLADAGLGQGALPRQRMLLRAGFFELPPAGYLPVDPKTPVEDQCSRMFGEGVHLHYHAVRKDEIGHLVEEAQHLDRISLTRGLDNPAAIEKVEIFVPDGLASDAQPAAAGTWWRTELNFRAVLALMTVAPADNGGQQPTQAPTASPTSVPTTAPSGKAKKAAASAKAEQTIHRTGFVKGLQSMAPGRLDAMFDGLTRTNKGEESGYAFTLVAVVELKKGAAGGTGARIAIYIAGDTGTDPFDLGLGGETSVKAELRMAAAAEGSGVTLGGTLTVLDLRANGAGEDERLVQLDTHAIEGTAGVPPTTRIKRMRLHLRRGGDAGSGIFLVDDDKNNPSSSPVLFDWDESPRQAAMYIAAEEDGDKAQASASGTPLPDQRVMNLTGLSAMPPPASAIGTATMSALAGLAEATDDPAFLLRARRRMFPTLEAPKTQTVRALHDWVMFRRARTHLCGPACVQPVAAGFEAFQVWHLRLEDAAQAQALAEALDKGDEKTLDRFEFKKVGILRYRSESAFSEEQASAVLGMWTPAQPGPKVLLGRVWEGQPTAGQGWQNHFRVRNMLDQISSLTEPPPRGDSSIAAIPLPSPKLGDSALDGGMLIVTAGQLAVRKGLAVLAPYVPPDHHPNKGLPHAPFEYGGGDTKALQEFIKALPEGQPGGLTLATVQALDLPAAQKRLDAVVDLMVAMGKSDILQGNRQVMKLSAFDHAQLVRVLEVRPEDYEDILFFEPVLPG